MKIIVTILAILMLAVTVSAQEYSRSSGNQTADALIYTGRAIVTKVMIATDGTNECKLALYGNTSATGTVIFPALPCPGTTLACESAPMNVLAPYGIYGDVTIAGGGGCTYNIHYQEY